MPKRKTPSLTKVRVSQQRVANVSDHIPAVPPQGRNDDDLHQTADPVTARYQQKGNAPMVGGQGVLTEAEAGSVVIAEATGGEVGEEDVVDHTAVLRAANREVGALTDRDEVDPGERDLNLE